MFNKIKTQSLQLKILNFLILTAPLIDVITSIMLEKTSFNLTLGMSIRTIFLVYLFLIISFEKNSKHKKYIYTLLSILGTFFMIYLFNSFVLKGNSSLFIEIKTILKIFYFPLFLVFIFSLFQKNKIDKPNTKIFTLSFFLYLSFIIIPTIFNVSLLTYSGGKVGYIGWFHSPNEIGAILSILFPFVFSYLFFQEYKKTSYFLFIIIVYIMFQIGTKVPMLAIFLTLFAYLFVNILRLFLNKKDFKKTIIRPIIFPITVCMIVSFIIFGFSNSNINLNIHKNTLLSHHKNEQNANNDDLGNSLNKVDYMNLIFSSRDKYTKELNNMFELSDIKEKLFGMGYMTDNNYNIVEIDYIDIFHIFGVVGFILYFSIIIVIIIDITIFTIKNYKKILNDYNIIPYYISLILTFGIAFFAGHVFTAPAVSIFPAIILPIIYLKIKGEGGLLTKLGRIFSKKIVYILPFLLLLIFSLSFILPSKDFAVKIIISDDMLQESKNLKLIETVNFEDEYDLNINDKIYHYEYREKELYFLIQLIQRTLSNDDKMIFWEISNLVGEKIHVDLVYQINQKDTLSKRIMFNEKEIQKEYSPIGGYDKITLPSMYLEFEKDNSLLISKSYRYFQQFTDYDNNEKSIVKNLIEERNDVTYSQNKINQKLSLNKSEVCEGYYIYSDHKLFEKEININDFTQILNESKYTPWLSYNGSYIKLPYSIEPYTTEAYGRNPGAILSRELLNRINESRIYENLLFNSIHILSHYMPREESGVWYTEFTSTWLKKDYQIRAPYVDTRHNREISITLFNIGNKLNNKKLDNSALLYADYLLAKFKQNDLIIFDENILFPDYFSTNHTQKTHSSLNHQLGIINYLFEAYIISDNLEYKKLALKLLQTIDQMHYLWIRDNNDLWYQVDKNLEFSRNDYVYLTLEDLIDVQEKLLLVGENKNNNINKLLKAKYNYLKKNDIPVSNNLKKKINKVMFK